MRPLHSSNRCGTAPENCTNGHVKLGPLTHLNRAAHSASAPLSTINSDPGMDYWAPSHRQVSITRTGT
jgi:hypothetical protein